MNKSPILNAKYIPNIGATKLPKLERMGVSGFNPNDLEAVKDSIITIGKPTANAESKKSKGRFKSDRQG